ncbi:MAG: hypothetical protein ABI175_10805 [Polyangiales bacterium]
MTRTLLISSLFVLATVAAMPAAHAAEAWVESAVEHIPYNCAGVPNANLAIQVGYVDDVASPLKTGDRGYVHAVAQAVGCTNGANMEVFLPAGATLDTTKQMYCIREKLDGSKQAVTNCAPWGFAGPNGGVMFTTGAVTLAPDWYLELQIPVVYNAELLGAAGGNSHKLGLRTDSLTAYTIASTPVTVGYRAKLENISSTNITLTSAQLNVNLFSYFKAGQLVIDYGTTTALGQSTTPGQVPATSASFPNANAVLSGLLPATTYFWRARFVTTSGTFVSDMLAFNTMVPVLSVATAGRGLGRITSNPAGIDCGYQSANVCAVNTAPGISVTLYPTPSSFAYVFTGWSGACTGTGLCTVSMDASKSVTANFDLFDSTTATPLPGPAPRR